MEKVVCKSCGANEFVKRNSFKVCAYCGTIYKIEQTSSIELEDDVSRLLKKCREDPYNAQKYANLVLDIDPGNIEALRYMRKTK